jgi:Xaa-Pro aminopeptidase
MNQHFSSTRKVSPTPLKPDGSPDDNDRIEIGPTKLAFEEWAAQGLEMPNLDAMRAYRHARIVDHIVARDCAGVLLFDPLSIRYATDSTNMQLWNTHNPFRACLVCADGHMVLFDYKNSLFLADFNPLVSDVRSGASMFYFSNGDAGAAKASELVQQVKEILDEHAPGLRRLAIDKIMPRGLRAFEAAGYEVPDGEELMEFARAIKGPDEIKAMRASIRACEAACVAMEDGTHPGMSEDDVWAILHAENIRRGGEWIETRLLSSGPRTNPWFQECGPRIIGNNEIVAYDTDLIGAYGICTDISRTYWVGDGDPRPDMIEDMRLGMEHIAYNMDLLKPGITIPEVVEQSHRLPDIYQKQKYSCLMHGVGLCDEWPHIGYPDHADAAAFNYPLEVGQCLCVEALISREGGDFSIKLEEQVVITEDGYENLTQMRFDERLLG